MDGTTYLPVRAVADALGLEVTWDQGARPWPSPRPGGQAPVPEESASPYSRTDPVPLGTAHTFRYAKGDDDWTITMQISGVPAGGTKPGRRSRRPTSSTIPPPLVRSMCWYG